MYLGTGTKYFLLKYNCTKYLYYSTFVLSTSILSTNSVLKRILRHQSNNFKISTFNSSDAHMHSSISCVTDAFDERKINTMKPFFKYSYDNSEHLNFID